MTAMRTETLLSVEGVGLTFDDNLILKDVNVRIDNLVRPDVAEATGQVVAFLGPSGRGKTQLLRILAGLQKPTCGEVYLGKDRVKVRPGSVGMVSQKYYLYRNRTVLGNLMVSVKQAGIFGKAAEEKCMAMLEKFDLADKINHYPVQLSGGQQQRVAIAQQLMCSEHFLLMDEPTAGLDVKNKNKVARLVTEVASQDDLNTIILVTHDIASALAIADTVWLMGCDRTRTGELIPGARIIDQYDLVERGLMWHPDVRRLPEFVSLVQEIEARFETL